MATEKWETHQKARTGSIQPSSRNLKPTSVTSKQSAISSRFRGPRSQTILSLCCGSRGRYFFLGAVPTRLHTSPRAAHRTRRTARYPEPRAHPSPARFNEAQASPLTFSKQPHRQPWAESCDRTSDPPRRTGTAPPPRPPRWSAPDPSWTWASRRDPSTVTFSITVRRATDSPRTSPGRVGGSPIGPPPADRGAKGDETPQNRFPRLDRTAPPSRRLPTTDASV